MSAEENKEAEQPKPIICARCTIFCGSHTASVQSSSAIAVTVNSIKKCKACKLFLCPECHPKEVHWCQSLPAHTLWELRDERKLRKCPGCEGHFQLAHLSQCDKCRGSFCKACSWYHGEWCKNLETETDANYKPAQEKRTKEKTRHRKQFTEACQQCEKQVPWAKLGNCDDCHQFFCRKCLYGPHDCRIRQFAPEGAKKGEWP